MRWLRWIGAAFLWSLAAVALLLALLWPTPPRWTMAANLALFPEFLDDRSLLVVSKPANGGVLRAAVLDAETGMERHARELPLGADVFCRRIEAPVPTLMAFAPSGLVTWLALPTLDPLRSLKPEVVFQGCNPIPLPAKGLTLLVGPTKAGPRTCLFDDATGKLLAETSAPTGDPQVAPNGSCVVSILPDPPSLGGTIAAVAVPAPGGPPPLAEPAVMVCLDIPSLKERWRRPVPRRQGEDVRAWFEGGGADLQTRAGKGPISRHDSATGKVVETLPRPPAIIPVVSDTTGPKLAWSDAPPYQLISPDDRLNQCVSFFNLGQRRRLAWVSIVRPIMGSFVADCLKRVGIPSNYVQSFVADGDARRLSHYRVAVGDVPTNVVCFVNPSKTLLVRSGRGGDDGPVTLLGWDFVPRPDWWRRVPLGLLPAALLAAWSWRSGRAAGRRRAALRQTESPRGA